MLRKLVLAALLALGFAAAVPQGVTAAPIGPAVALPAEAAPGVVQKAYYIVYRRYRPRYYRRRYYYRPRYYRPRYYRRHYYHRRRFWYF